jgi:hypothetical protein
LFQPGIGWLWTPGNLGRGGSTTWRPSTVTWVRAKSGAVGAVPTHPLDVVGKTPANLEQGVFPVAKGTVGNTTVASSNEQWKVEKNPGREAVSSALVTSARPSLVSRSLTQGSGSRFRGNSSGMAFDAASHRFVNVRSGSSVAMSDRVQHPETGKPVVLTSAKAGRSEALPSRRPLTPAPSASERTSSGGFSSFGGGRSSSGRTTTTTTTTRSSAGTASSSGRPH